MALKDGSVNADLSVRSPPSTRQIWADLTPSPGKRTERSPQSADDN
ncbi:MAG: hypothetical protein ACP5D7_22980 [Limnospira sp.]